MGKPYTFQNEELKDMVGVGAVDADSARIWLRAEKAGEIMIRWWPESDPDAMAQTEIYLPEENDTDNTCSLKIPNALDQPHLDPLRRYRFRIFRKADNSIIGEGGFETRPRGPEGTPSKFSVAIMSCHQPFTEKGVANPKSRQMLQAVLETLREHNTKYVMMVGDQMYSDYPPNLSLFGSNHFNAVAPPGRKRILDCSPAEIRQMFHRHYRHFFSVPEWKTLNAEYPCYPILDDHDIVDNWGSVPEHKNPEWQRLSQGARLAYQDYQGSKMSASNQLPDSFHYGFCYGNTATFVMDLRSARRAGKGGQLYDSRQQADFQHFLAENADQKVLFIVLSVPVVHLPKILAKIAVKLPHSPEDFADRWSSGAHIRDRDRFFKILHEHQQKHPDQKVVLLSGDIHIGCVHRMEWKPDGPGFYQIISSGITHATGGLIRHASTFLIKINREIATDDSELRAKVRLLKGIDRRQQNPLGQLNMGIVEMETLETGGECNLRFYLYGHKKGEPYKAFESKPL